MLSTFKELRVVAGALTLLVILLSADLSQYLGLQAPIVLDESGHHIIHVGVPDIRYSPLFSVDGKYFYGFTRDVLDLFAKTYNYAFVYVPMNPMTLSSELQYGSGLEAQFPDNPKWKRGEKPLNMVDIGLTIVGLASVIPKSAEIEFSDPILQYKEGMIVTLDNFGKGLEGIRTIATVSVCQMASYRGSKIIRTNSTALLIHSLAEGKIDGAYLNPYVAKKMAEELRLDFDNTFIFDEALPFSRGVYTISSVKLPQLIVKFNEFLKRHRDEILALEKLYVLNDLDSVKVLPPVKHRRRKGSRGQSQQDPPTDDLEDTSFDIVPDRTEPPRPPTVRVTSKPPL